MAISFPLLGQGYAPYNLEIGFSQATSLPANLISGSYDDFPLGVQVYYWQDMKNFKTNTPDSAWMQKDDKKIANLVYNCPVVGAYLSFYKSTPKSQTSYLTAGLSTDLGLVQGRYNYLSVRPKIGLSHFFSSNFLYYSTNTKTSFLTFNAGLGLYYTLQKPIKTVKIGAEFNYFGNGAVHQPAFSYRNLSLNFAYQFGPELFPWDKNDRKMIQDLARIMPDTNFFTLQLSTFTKQFESNKNRYIGGVLSLKYRQQLGVYFNLEMGLLYSIDPARKQELMKKYFINGLNNSRLGLVMGLVWKFNRFKIHASPGIYLYKPEKTLDDFWFQNYQLDYQINRKFYTFASLLMHIHQADFIDFGLGYRI
jgi:hypothetical protein